MAEETVVHKVIQQVIQVPDLITYRYTVKLESTTGKGRKFTIKVEGHNKDRVMLELVEMEDLLKSEPNEIKAVLKR